MENDDVLLKRFLSCDTCGKFMRAYKSKKIDKWYYKCCTKGCGSNKRADDLHERFQAMLESLTIPPDEQLNELVRIKLAAKYREANKENTLLKSELNKQLAELEKKISRLEERYVLEEIDREMFFRFKEKYQAERAELVANLGLTEMGVSNLENALESAMAYVLKLAPMWAFSDYENKQKLQNLVFPSGMTYNREKDECRTSRINSVFAYMSSLALVLENKKTGNSSQKFGVAGLVEGTGEMSDFFEGDLGLFKRM